MPCFFLSFTAGALLVAAIDHRDKVAAAFNWLVAAFNRLRGKPPVLPR